MLINISPAIKMQILNFLFYFSELEHAWGCLLLYSQLQQYTKNECYGLLAWLIINNRYIREEGNTERRLKLNLRMERTWLIERKIFFIVFLCVSDEFSIKQDDQDHKKKFCTCEITWKTWKNIQQISMRREMRNWWWSFNQKIYTTWWWWSETRI